MTDAPDHLATAAAPGPLAAHWGLWRWVEVRGTGLPVEPLLALAAPAAARAADAVVAAQNRVEETRWTAVRALRAAVDDHGDGEHRSTLRRWGRPVRHDRAAEALTALRDVPAAARVLASLAEAAAAVERRDTAMASYHDTLRTADAAVTGALTTATADPLLREALAWQNPRALRTAVDPLHRALVDGTNAKARWAPLVARYLQRYCAKNDTIGFFGPVGVGRIDDATTGLDIRPGPGLLAGRTVAMESWAAQAIAETLTTPATRPWARPRRLPTVGLDADGARRPLSPVITLPAPLRAVLAACDGTRTAVDLAANLGLATDTVVASLTDLAERGLISWSFEVSPAAAHPEDDLRHALVAIDDPGLRTDALARLDRVLDARDAVTASAGNADAVLAAVERLGTEFTELTGTDSTRRPGVFYGARAVVVEDCRRDLTLTIGPDLIEGLWEPLSAVLEAARWFTHAGAALHRRALRDVYRAHCPGGDPVALTDLSLWADDVFRDTDRLVRPLVRALTERWARVLDLPADPGARHVIRDAGPVAARAEEVFAAPGPGWRAAVQHSPDLLLDRTDSGVRWVLGEVHPGMNTMRSAMLVAQHPTPDDLHAAMRADLGGPRVVPAATRGDGGTPQRLADGLVGADDIVVAWAPDSCDPTALRAADCTVVEQAGRLVVRDRAGRLDHDLIEVLAEHVMARLLQRFRVLAPARHTPRVSVGDLVVARETWRVPSTALPGADLHGDDPGARLLAARRWALDLGLPDRVFVRSPLEPKPLYVDLTAPLSASVLAPVCRTLADQRPGDTLTVSEMLPEPDGLWLTDADGGRYTAELRVVAVDRRGASTIGS